MPYETLLAIYIGVVICMGLLAAYALHSHHNDLYIVKKNYASIVEDLTAIAEHIENTNELLEERRGLVKDCKKRCK